MSPAQSLCTNSATLATKITADKAYGTGLKNKENRIISQVSWNGNDPDDCADQLIAAAASSILSDATR